MLSVASSGFVYIYPWDPLTRNLNIGWRVEPYAPDGDPRIILHSREGCIVEWEWWATGGMGTLIGIIEGIVEGK